MQFMGDYTAEFGRGPDKRPRKRRISREGIGRFLGNPLDKAKAGYKSVSIKPGGAAGSIGNRLRQTAAAASNLSRTRGGKIGAVTTIASGLAGAGYISRRRKRRPDKTPNAYANNPYYRTPLDRNIRRTEMSTRSIRNLASGARAASDVSREIRSWRRALLGG